VTSPRGAHLIGQPLHRQEDPRLVKGKGSYVGDLTRPGMIHMAVLRSPHAHARITARDLQDARQCPAWSRCCRSTT
jgi:carbon-monoxide dehydrogenase large subunit